MFSNPIPLLAIFDRRFIVTPFDPRPETRCNRRARPKEKFRLHSCSKINNMSSQTLGQLSQMTDKQASTTTASGRSSPTLPRCIRFAQTVLIIPEPTPPRLVLVRRPDPPAAAKPHSVITGSVSGAGDRLWHATAATERYTHRPAKPPRPLGYNHLLASRNGRRCAALPYHRS